MLNTLYSDLEEVGILGCWILMNILINLQHVSDFKSSLVHRSTFMGLKMDVNGLILCIYSKLKCIGTEFHKKFPLGGFIDGISGVKATEQ